MTARVTGNSTGQGKGTDTREPTATTKLDPKLVRQALVLVVGMLAAVFDTTIVSVALHPLATDLRTTVGTIQWVTTSYLLTLSMTVPLTTWAQRRLGGRHLWLTALVIFLVGSVGASLAWNPGALIGFRVVQGIGGGIMMPLSATLIMQSAQGKNLGRVITLAALPGLLGPILGPVIGGAILTNLSWRYMFWVNIPFCVAGFILAWIYLPSDSPAATKPKLDWVGLTLLAPGIAAVLLGLTNAGRTHGFTHVGAIVPLVIGVALITAFALYALRRPEPLVDLRLLRRRQVAAASGVIFFSGFALFGAMLLLPMFYQQVRGASALAAGFMLIPQGLGTLTSRSMAGKLTDAVGARPIALVGFVIVTLTTVPFAFANAETSSWWLAVWLFLRGFGLGTVTMPVMTAAYIGLEPALIPHASVLTRTAQQVGGSFGTAVLAVILQQSQAGHVSSTSTAYNTAFWWSVGFSALAVALSFWLPSKRSSGD